MKRIRLTIDGDILGRALDYARLSHTDLSGLISEALEQHMRRYPREARKPSVEARLAEIEKILGLAPKTPTRVPAGTFTGDFCGG